MKNESCENDMRRVDILSSKHWKNKISHFSKGLIKTFKLQLKQLETTTNKFFGPGLLRPEAYLELEISHKSIYIDTTSNIMKNEEFCMM